MRALHTQRKQLTVMLDVLVDRALYQLGLLEARHQRGIADLLLRGLMDLDRGLRTHDGLLGTSVPLRIPCCYAPEQDLAHPGFRPSRHDLVGRAAFVVAPDYSLLY
jgi:hypothetical protein